MLPFQNEWTILEWDKGLQANNHTYNPNMNQTDYCTFLNLSWKNIKNI